MRLNCLFSSKYFQFSEDDEFIEYFSHYRRINLYNLYICYVDKSQVYFFHPFVNVVLRLSHCYLFISSLSSVYCLAVLDVS